MSPDLGANLLAGNRCRFRVWAPRAERVEVHLLFPQERWAQLEKVERGYHQAVVEGVEAGARYTYRLDGGPERPDPASRYQPLDVHGPSEVVDTDGFAWTDAGWCAPPLEKFVLYELHVGTYTPEGTFDAVLPHLPALKNLGITAIELMPVAQFSGPRNWGYDGVFPYAAQNTYGGPQGLKRLVDACHREGLAVVLDVVYNHLGPEGNHLGEFGPYFTDRYRTPWGPALNFDAPQSDEVRHYFIENALYWLTDFHLDGLRLDAIHGIYDFSAKHFLADLTEAVRKRAGELNRRLYLIAESDLNDVRTVLPCEMCGHGLDAQWNDDFHHALHALLTGERDGYYADFGDLAHLAKALREGFVLSGQHSVFRHRRHGSSSRAVPAYRFVVFAKNHDQVGNRMRGERLSQLVDFEALKLAAGLVLLSPYIPLLFMGDEYGETAPFQYFVSHSDPELIESVRNGRRQEFNSFNWRGELPDPEDEATFQRSKLNHGQAREGRYRALRALHQELIRLRRELPALARLSKEQMEVMELEAEKILLLRRGRNEEQVAALFHFGTVETTARVGFPTGVWRKQLDSADRQWCGSGSAFPENLRARGEVELRLVPRAFSLYLRSPEEGS